MSAPGSVRTRLATQLEALAVILTDVPLEAAERRPASGDWSARENLAHLARHAEVFLERLQRIPREDRPALGTYSAEDDPEWTAWTALPLDEALRRLRDTRIRLIAWVDSLGPAEVARTGVHPLLGEMSLAAWLEFFLLHEAHHLYTAMLRVGAARRRPA